MLEKRFISGRLQLQLRRQAWLETTLGYDLNKCSGLITCRVLHYRKLPGVI